MCRTRFECPDAILHEFSRVHLWVLLVPHPTCLDVSLSHANLGSIWQLNSLASKSKAITATSLPEQALPTDNAPVRTVCKLRLEASGSMVNALAMNCWSGPGGAQPDGTPAGTKRSSRATSWTPAFFLRLTPVEFMIEPQKASEHRLHNEAGERTGWTMDHSPLMGAYDPDTKRIRDKLDKLR